MTVKRFIWKIFVVAVVLSLIFPPACTAIRSLGKYPSKGDRISYMKYPGYDGEMFHNIYKLPDSLVVARTSRSVFRKERWHRLRKPRLSQEMPSVKTDLNRIDSEKPVIVWFGHSSYLIRTGGLNILVDPVFSGYGSPVSFINRCFDGADIYKTGDMPPIDLLIITHDHYDHLDYKTVRKLRKSVSMAVVPVGVGNHLRYWGYDDQKVKEVFWGDSVSVSNKVQIISTPAQHFSGRRNKRNRTLWSSYVLQLDGYRIFLGGDSGYNEQYADIGRQYGPFDLAILENGQYSPYWPGSHAYPPQTVLAARQLQADMLLPVHWAKFSASYHTWNDPVKRILPVADSMDMKITVPRIGEPYMIGDHPIRKVWWDFD